MVNGTEQEQAACRGGEGGEKAVAHLNAVEATWSSQVGHLLSSRARGYT